MSKNQEDVCLAHLSREELEKLEQLEQDFGYALVAHDEQPTTHSNTETPRI